jgi:hypothetical protein
MMSHKNFSDSFAPCKSKSRLNSTARFIPAIKEMVTDMLGACLQLEARVSDEDIRHYFSSRQLNFKSFLKNNQTFVHCC